MAVIPVQGQVLWELCTQQEMFNFNIEGADDEPCTLGRETADPPHCVMDTPDKDGKGQPGMPTKVTHTSEWTDLQGARVSQAKTDKDLKCYLTQVKLQMLKL